MVTESQNGKKSYKTDTIKDLIREDDYCIEFSNGKQQVIEYQYLINTLNKYDEDDVERWTFETINDHRWYKDKNQKGKIYVLISRDGYKEENWAPMEIINKDDPVTLAKYAFDNNIID